MAAHACTIPHDAVGSDWCVGRTLLDKVAAIYRTIPMHEAIHVSGHYTLRSIIDCRLARFGDHVWTSFRNLRDIVLSYVNYILTTLEADPGLSRLDARNWAKRLRLKAPPGTLKPPMLRALLSRMIRDDALLPRNLVCHFLGDGTAASTLDLLAAANVEVIESTRLDQWREQRWSVPAPPWANVSRQFFRWSTLDDGARREIAALVKQDATLHRTVAASLGTAASVGGMRIARGSAAAASSASDRPAVRSGGRASRTILLDPGFRPWPGRGARTEAPASAGRTRR